MLTRLMLFDVNNQVKNKLLYFQYFTLFIKKDIIETIRILKNILLL